MARAFEKYKAQTPKLVLIGQRGWECEQVIDLLERSPAIRQCLVEIPSASDSRIVDVLKNARALLFPSYVEGYGLPLVEALYLGVPVLASDIEVFNEIRAADSRVYSPNRWCFMDVLY